MIKEDLTNDEKVKLQLKFLLEIFLENFLNVYYIYSTW